ncbi:hypothetical protein IAU59_000233 [Kwoniella sp. CBS 9459]
MSTAPFREDALNRYRITHSDRDLKPLIRRIHRLPLLADALSASGSSTGEGHEDVNVELELERELIKMELFKWRAGVERVVGSISNLERQTEVYRRQAQATVEQTEQLRQTLAKEKEELERKKKWREHQVRCDEIARRISARGKSRAELDEQISNLQTSLEEHRSSHAIYLQTTQSRIDTFSQITRLIDECRSLKLPVDPNAIVSTLTTTTTTGGEDEGKMDVDPTVPIPVPGLASGSSSKLSASAVPFQPGLPGSASVPAPSPITSAASTNNSTAAAASIGGRSSAPPSQAAPSSSSSSKLKVPTSGHLLPSRPAANRSTNSAGAGSSTTQSPTTTTTTTTTTLSGGVKLTRQGSAGLPNRPSNLRSSTTPAALHGPGSGSEGITGNLEDGEVGPEEGEVADENRKRGRGSESSSRNTRSRNK